MRRSNDDMRGWAPFGGHSHFVITWNFTSFGLSSERRKGVVSTGALLGFTTLRSGGTWRTPTGRCLFALPSGSVDGRSPIGPAAFVLSMLASEGGGMKLNFSRQAIFWKDGPARLLDCLLVDVFNGQTGTEFLFSGGWKVRFAERCNGLAGASSRIEASALIPAEPALRCRLCSEPLHDD
jgi:hypothetical protein